MFHLHIDLNDEQTDGHHFNLAHIALEINLAYAKKRTPVYERELTA